MKTLLVILIVSGAIWLAWKSVAQDQQNHAYILPNKIALEWKLADETRVWISLISTNGRDWAKDGYHPSYTSILVRDYKPIVKKLSDGQYEITFVSPIAQDLP